MNDQSKFTGRSRWGRPLLALFAFLALIAASANFWAQDQASSPDTLHENVHAREQWFLFQRTYPFPTLPPDARFKVWRALQESLKSGRAAATPAWQLIGPTSTSTAYPKLGLESGRINTIAVSPGNTQIVLVGSAEGGIWRSADGGSTFVPVSDNQVDLAVGSIAFASSNPNIVYAGMGDPYGYVGTGVLKSTDAGQTWNRISNDTLPAPGQITNVLVDPSNPNHVYVAQLAQQVNGTYSVGGFYVSSDGGVNWTLTLAGLPRDLVFSPTNSQTLYLAMQWVNQGSGQPAGLYQSTDGGQTWTLLEATPYDSGGTQSIHVAVSPAGPQMIFIWEGGTINGAFDARLVVSLDGGKTWTSKGSGGVDTGQFDYNDYLQVDPQNPNVIYIGSRDVWKSTDGGATWTNLTRDFTGSGSSHFTPNLASAHADQHALAFSPGNSSDFYIGNDGGLWKTIDGGNTFQNENGTLTLTQFYRLQAHPSNTTFIFGGAQDNGAQQRTDPSNVWKEIITGDGGPLVTGHSDPSLLFAAVDRDVIRFTNFGADLDADVGPATAFGESTSNPRINFIPPFTGDEVDDKLFYGSWKLFVSTDEGNTWNAPGGGLDLTKGGGDTLSVIAVSSSNPSIIYTGSTQGRAMVSTNSGVAWTDITAGLPNRSITSIKIDPTNPATAYLSVSGFGSGHVFKTTNMGASWTDLSGNLPDIPTSALLIDPLNPSILYAGTDVGVFQSSSSSGNWQLFNTGMPPVVIDDFTSRSDGLMVAATFGRGAYEMQSTGGSGSSNTQDLVSVPGSGAITALTASSAGALQAGYAVLSVNSGSAPYATAVFSLMQNGVVVSEAGVPASPPTTSAGLFVDYRNNAPAKSGHLQSGTLSVDTGVAIVNRGSAQANLTFTLRDMEGRMVGATGHGSLAPGAHVAKFLERLVDIAPDFVIPANFPTAIQFGSLEINSDQPISVLALRLTVNQRGETLITSTPTVDFTQPPSFSPLYFPQLADGVGYKTTIVLINTSSTNTETGKVLLFDNNGAALSVHTTTGQPANSNFPYSMAPGEVFLLQTDGAGIPGSASPKVGAVQVIPSGGTPAPVGAGIFGYSPAGTEVTESGVPSALTTTHARIYVDQSGGHTTGLALENPTAAPLTVNVSAFQLDGVTPAGTSLGPVELPGNGHISAFVNSFVGNLPNNFTGVLDIRSSSPFAPLTLRGLYNARNDFLLTTLPTADFTRPAPSPIVFPQIADGNGGGIYRTQFIFLSTGGSESTTLSFFGDTGSPLAVGKSGK